MSELLTPSKKYVYVQSDFFCMFVALSLHFNYLIKSKIELEAGKKVLFTPNSMLPKKNSSPLLSTMYIIIRTYIQEIESSDENLMIWFFSKSHHM